ncbi:Ca2+/Na+ antiporter [Pedobacter sp. AK013]|jgi:Ca2+/Na+ antiporter|uniref:hypothetical protein n=1 Tax=Pedobacter sp. AK013 TaxID=2723071 RepID=UPI00121063E0|nr:hypothetical protein [Pedobacter sp. AK013]MBB6240172.1 Ca2+/Na+ antiporter [Pedobacter sp. AK013]RZK39210.1 MAG: hypothetical protein EOO90_19500 [Pedobacter sp.]
MKTVILFLITIVISTGALLASLNAKNPIVGPLVALAMVVLFVLYLTGKNRRRVKQREKERLFYNYFNAMQNKRSRF